MNFTHLHSLTSSGLRHAWKVPRLSLALLEFATYINLLSPSLRTFRQPLDGHGRTFADLYQRYKIGTNRITQWLADTANDIGKLESIVDRQTRKALKHSALRGSSHTVRISTSQLVRLASEVSITTLRNRAPPKDIRDIIIITEDVLAGRRDYSVWNEQKTTTKDAEHRQQNESHQHFIHVLVEVLDHLKRAHKYSQPVVSRPKATRGKKKPSAASVAVKPDDSTVLKNIYKGLALEEPAIDSLEESVEHFAISEPICTKP